MNFTVATVVRRVLAMALIIVCFGSARALALEPVSVLVLDFELNDLTLNPATEFEEKRVKTLRPLLTAKLEENLGYKIAELSQDRRDEEDRGKGYIFDRPEVSAKMARAASADWVVTGRLHKASFLFVYLKSQLIDPSAQVRADFVVEIKGWEPRLTEKGIDALALQIDESIRTLVQANKAKH